jgi:uncharacterized membrane protein YeaQ/YmgE (transglycosylase-associated protein family)
MITFGQFIGSILIGFCVNWAVTRGEPTLTGFCVGVVGAIIGNFIINAVLS